MATDSQFTLAQKYLPILDEVYKKSTLTSILDAANSNIQFIGADTVKIYNVSSDGLGNYNRNSGFVSGSVTGTWETLTLDIDRGRKFLIDRCSDSQSLNMALASTVGQFQRTKVAPETDAIRFAKYFAGCGLSASAAITVGTTDVPDLIDAAEEAMGDAEVPQEGRVLFVSEKCYRGLKNKIVRKLANEGEVSHEIEVYDNMPVIRVPNTRFFTGVTLLDGSTAGQTAGGFVGETGAYKMNFMIVHPSAVVQAKYIELPSIIAPEYNNDADGYIFKYRLHHGAFVKDNAKNGIYCHYDTTALT